MRAAWEPQETEATAVARSNGSQSHDQGKENDDELARIHRADFDRWANMEDSDTSWHPASVRRVLSEGEYEDVALSITIMSRLLASISDRHMYLTCARIFLTLMICTASVHRMAQTHSLLFKAFAQMRLVRGRSCFV